MARCRDERGSSGFVRKFFSTFANMASRARAGH